MVDERLVDVLVRILPEYEDDEELDRLTRQLRAEALDLGVESAELVAAGPTPNGAKAIDPVLLGTLLLATSPIVLTKLLEFLHAWSMRREGRHVKIKIQIDSSSSLEVEFPASMSPAEIKNWINTLKGTIAQKRKG